MRFVLSFLVVSLLTVSAVAQDTRQVLVDALAPKPGVPVLQPVYTYAAKFVCGSVPQPFVVAPGMYFSAVNVHNPSRWETTTLRKKFAVGLPGEEVGKISPYFDKKLRADEAMLIDCRNIYGHLQMTPWQFIEGYVVIESNRELDVVTVYTAGNGASSLVTTMHTERVPVRVARACNDLKLSLKPAGTPWPWQVITDPSGGQTPRPVQLVTHTWVPGEQTATATASQSAAGGTYEYQFCFCLCTGGAKINITKLIADNTAQVFVNNQPAGPLINSNINATWASAPQLAQINSAVTNVSLPAGENCIKVRVTNQLSSLTGFFIDGSITGANAACPKYP